MSRVSQYIHRNAKEIITVEIAILLAAGMMTLSNMMDRATLIPPVASITPNTCPKVTNNYDGTRVFGQAEFGKIAPTLCADMFEQLKRNLQDQLGIPLSSSAMQRIMKEVTGEGQSPYSVARVTVRLPNNQTFVIGTTRISDIQLLLGITLNREKFGEDATANPQYAGKLLIALTQISSLVPHPQGALACRNGIPTAPLSCVPVDGSTAEGPPAQNTTMPSPVWEQQK